MTYAIGSVFYGVDFTGYGGHYGHSEWKPYSEVIRDLVEDDLLTRQYSGNGDYPTYLGADMFEIDECTRERPRSWTLEPSEEQIQEYRDKLAAVEEALDPEDELHMGFLDLLKAAKPDVWLVWGSS